VAALNEVLLLFIAYAASLFMAWNIGANDASNPTDTVVGAGALSINKAIILFSIFAGIGAVMQGWMVMKTLGKGVVPSLGVAGALSAVLAGGLWVLIATLKGLPVSTSQSITGGVIGTGLSYVALGLISIGDIRWSIVLTIILSWLISPAASIALSILLYLLFERIFLKRIYTERVAKILRMILIASLVFSAYSFGANDVGNATGVYVAITSRYLGLPDVSTRMFLALLGSIGIALGAFTLGRRVIATVAYKITHLDLLTGMAAEYANALTVWLFTTVPYMLIGYGMPVSTTHASVSAIIGVGIARSRSFRGVRWKTVLLIIMSWLLTLPITIALGFTIHYIMYNLLFIQ